MIEITQEIGAKYHMKYIIADPDAQSGIDLKKILDGYEMLDFQGSGRKPFSKAIFLSSHEEYVVEAFRM